MQNDWQDTFKDLLEGFCTGFKGKHPNQDFLWRCSLKTWKINTVHLQKCGHFCLKDLKCQECRQPSSSGFFWFHTSLVQLWALSKEGKAQRGAAPVCARSCEQEQHWGADRAAEPWGHQVGMGNPEWWIPVLCRTPLCLQRLPQSVGWPLITASSHFSSHSQAEGMRNENSIIDNPGSFQQAAVTAPVVPDQPLGFHF